MQQDETFMQYFPDKLAKNRLPEREYFFNVMNTLMEEYTQAIMQHANTQRTTGEAQAKADATIEISEEWWDKLQAVPFKSRKWLSACNFF